MVLLQSVLAMLALLWFASPALAQSADLSVTVSRDIEKVMPGDVVTYTYVVYNAGPDTASRVEWRFTAPDGLTAVTGGMTLSGTGGGACGDAMCTLSMPPGSSGTYSVTGTVAASAGASLVASTSAISDEPDPNPTNSSATDTAYVGIETSTELTASPNPSYFGQTVTFTATVTADDGTPDGMVSFYIDGTPAGGDVALDNGVATFTTNSLSVGGRVVRARYAGNGDHASSDDMTSQTVRATGTLGLTIGFGQARFLMAGESVDVEYRVSNTGDVTVFGIALTAPSVSGLNCPAVNLTAGASMLCSATYLTTDADVTAGSVTLGASVVGNTQPLATASATLLSSVGDVREEVVGATEAFIGTRNRLLANGIHLPGLLDRSGGSSVGLSEVNGLPVLEFATSLSHPGLDAASALADGRELPFNLWLDSSFAVHGSADTEGLFGLVGMGADYLVSDTVLLGVAAYLDWMTDNGVLTRIEGYGGLIGPYLSVRLGERAVLGASLLYGRSFNDSETEMLGDSFTGSFETSRLVGKVSLTGEWLVDQLTLRPDATLFVSHEAAEDYVVRNGLGAPVAIPGTEVSQFQLSGGLTVEQGITLDSGLELTPSVSVRSGVNDDFAGLGWDDLFASATAGLTLGGDGWTLRGTADGTVSADGVKFGGVRGSFSGAF